MPQLFNCIQCGMWHSYDRACVDKVGNPLRLQDVPKPNLRIHTWDRDAWVCQGHGAWAYGFTMQQAYDAWRAQWLCQNKQKHSDR